MKGGSASPDGSHSDLYCMVTLQDDALQTSAASTNKRCIMVVEVKPWLNQEDLNAIKSHTGKVIWPKPSRSSGMSDDEKEALKNQRRACSSLTQLGQQMLSSNAPLGGIFTSTDLLMFERGYDHDEDEIARKESNSPSHSASDGQKSEEYVPPSEDDVNSAHVEPTAALKRTTRSFGKARAISPPPSRSRKSKSNIVRGLCDDPHPIGSPPLTPSTAVEVKTAIPDAVLEELIVSRNCEAVIGPSVYGQDQDKAPRADKFERAERLVTLQATTYALEAGAGAVLLVTPTVTVLFWRRDVAGENEKFSRDAEPGHIAWDLVPVLGYHKDTKERRVHAILVGPRARPGRLTRRHGHVHARCLRTSLLPSRTPTPAMALFEVDQNGVQTLKNGPALGPSLRDLEWAHPSTGFQPAGGNGDLLSMRRRMMTATLRHVVVNPAGQAREGPVDEDI